MGITDKTHEGIVSEQLQHKTHRNWENSWESDRLDAIWWGLIFLWGALVLLLDNTSFSANYTWWDGWGVFLTGAGVMALIGVPVRSAAPRVPTEGRGDPNFWTHLTRFRFSIGLDGSRYTVNYWCCDRA